jgi:hypothetical protein
MSDRAARHVRSDPGARSSRFDPGTGEVLVVRLNVVNTLF